MKGKNIIIFLIVLIIIFMIGISINKFVIHKDDSNNENINSNTNTNNNISLYNGIYKLDNATIKLYAVSNDKVNYSYTASMYVSSGTYDYVDGKLEYDFFDDIYKASLDQNNNLVLDSSNKDIVSGTYTKSSEYKLDDYYTDNYGSLELLNNEYNGKYTYEKDYIYVYQAIDKTIRLSGYVNGTNVGIDMDIDGNKYTSDIFDDHYEVTLVNDNIHLVLKVEGKVTYEKDFVRQSKLTKEDIINNFMTGSY